MIFFLLLHCPLREIRVAYLGKVTVATTAAIPIPTTVCVQSFLVSKQWYIHG